MVIIFYDSEKEQVYICTERDKMKIVPIDDDNLMSHIPNDDVLYVQNAHVITKKQFGDWINGDIEFEQKAEPHRFTGFTPDDPEMKEPIVHSEHSDPDSGVADYSQKKFIHPKHHGSIIIADLKTPKFPDGVKLNGKWDFVPVEDLGEDAEESRHLKALLDKGKIEVVSYEYVKKNIHRKQQSSRADAALDAIIIKDQSPGSAEKTASGGGLNYQAQSDVMEIYVE